MLKSIHLIYLHTCYSIHTYLHAPTLNTYIRCKVEIITTNAIMFFFSCLECFCFINDYFQAIDRLKQICRIIKKIIFIIMFQSILYLFFNLKTPFLQFHNAICIELNMSEDKTHLSFMFIFIIQCFFHLKDFVRSRTNKY